MLAIPATRKVVLVAVIFAAHAATAPADSTVRLGAMRRVQKAADPQGDRVPPEDRADRVGFDVLTTGELVGLALVREARVLGEVRGTGVHAKIALQLRCPS